MDKTFPPGPSRRPGPAGLYDPSFEHDACGVGFIAHLKGKRSHAIVRDALTMLSRMDHRGACGCEENTGDGAGILTALPHALLRRAARQSLDVELPADGRYAAGNVFFPQKPEQHKHCKKVFEQELEKVGVGLLGWRVLPVDPDGADIGPTARRGQPTIEQLFVAAPASLESSSNDDNAFERLLYLVRNRVVNRVAAEHPEVASGAFYICSLSTRVMIYKGQLTSQQVPAFYPDLRDPEYTSHLAMVHSRFSTNTFPSWDRAQPCRMMSHNGEINTLKGNVNWVRARQGLMRAPAFGDDTTDLFPVVNAEASDSGSFDNVFEMLVMSGRSLPEAMMMMIPEAWEHHEAMPADRKAFYEYHANLIEPWDGPATVSFTDGKVIGATLDRNGLRPSRYYVTDDDRVILASEVGVVDVDPGRVVRKGRLEPGKMFLVDFDLGRIVSDGELKSDIAGKRPYGKWLDEHRLTLDDASAGYGRRAADGAEPSESDEQATAQLRAFGYTSEHLQLLLAPMVRSGKEALGSMGNDQAPACLSDKPRLVYDYFQQLFAQVTNPPIDPIREELIMSLRTPIGPEGNLLETTPAQCNRLVLDQPVLRDAELSALKAFGKDGWQTREIDITFARPDLEGLNGRADAVAGAALTEALDRVCAEVSRAIDDGVSLAVLSDRNAGPDRVAIPALLACGAAHHHLIRQRARTRIGLVLETGEAREVHHFATLIGFGADAINPYLAFRAIDRMQRRGMVDAEMPADKCQGRYIEALGKGLLKVMSKMGISTLASYKGAQIFEALGLGADVVDRCFAGCPSRLKGVGFDVLGREAVRRHEVGFPRRPLGPVDHLPNLGEYHWRPEGDVHANSPEVIARLQAAARQNSRQAYEDFATTVNNDPRHRCTFRGLLELDASPEGAPRVPLEEVEPAKDIVKRFRTGAMSLGALSREAHESLALAMNRVGGLSNSGEGGEDPGRYALAQYDDGSVKSRRSGIKQVASGRFGVTSHYLANADRIQIKIAQGAKPGEGGQLPGFKVDPYIASIRHSTPGVGLISPPPHHDIYSIEDLAQLIFDLKNANPSAWIAVKLVAEVGVGTIASGVAKAHADAILISGHDGGTGASPLTSVKHAGLPWELGLAETHQTLVMNDLRSRVRLEADGGMRTGRDVAIAACLGAEEFGFSTAPMIALGCIMMRKCHLNTCPVGVCTQDPVLRKKFSGTPEHVLNYLFLVAEELRGLMSRMGVRTIDEMVGRVDLLGWDAKTLPHKARGLDLGPILQPPPNVYPDAGVRKLREQDHGIDRVLDRTLIDLAGPALEDAHPVVIEHPIRNVDRSAGTMLSHEVSKRYGAQGLPDGTIDITLRGSAGQSLGAWLAKGVSIKLIGDANDYVGKGLSGGRIVVAPPAESRFAAEANVLIGNVALYGATSGQAYFRGVAAERFAVRNSGALAVVEGVGEHGCEYMTGGRVVVLGPAGRNFAAGMSGGVAYVYDRDGDFAHRCNMEMVELEPLDQPADVEECLGLIRNHLEHTGSAVAQRVLENWHREGARFLKVMPVDYRKVLMAQQRENDRAPSMELGHG
ncbi:MAG: glutamate synthase large subunit [Planctomycetota bacterium]